MVNKKNWQPVTIVMPAFNEENAIGAQVKSVRSTLMSGAIEHEILVVDDGSTDRTSEQAILAGARLVQHTRNRGYGAALKTGIQAASYEDIVIIDSDGTYPSEHIPELIARLQESDMVVGARVGEKVKQPWIRQPAKKILTMLATRIAEQPILDLNSGLRAFRRNCIMQYFSILPNRFSFTSTVTLAYMADDYLVEYIPINYHHRVGKSKIVPWDFMDFLALILRMSMMFNPLKVFIPLSILIGGLGIVKTIYDIVAVFLRSPARGLDLLLEPVLSTSAVLLLFAGLQILMIGMVADGVIRRISQHNRPLVPSQRKLQVVDFDEPKELVSSMDQEGI